MKIFQNFPTRQKFLLITVLIIGLFILIYSTTNQFSEKKINDLIFFYGIGVPASLLFFSTIMDLNNDKIFMTWLIFSILLLILCVTSGNSDKFLIHRSARFDKSAGINSWITDHSTSTLKTLFFFLLVYWPLNQLSKKKTGNFIVNTYWQGTWFNSDANRKMTGMDVITNIILFLTIICAALF